MALYGIVFPVVFMSITQYKFGLIFFDQNVFP